MKTPPLPFTADWLSEPASTLRVGGRHTRVLTINIFDFANVTAKKKNVNQVIKK